MPTADKILDWDGARAQCGVWKDHGKEVVFTNGCFDILHLGHIDYLEKARALGQRLIVGLNNDSSVARIKGPQRPINPEYARARLLAALSFVDAVVVFGEDTPLELITHLTPSVLVKGSDYQVEDIVGAEVVVKHGGEVRTIDLVEGYSTTKIIEKAGE